MMITTIPSVTVALLIYTVAGLSHHTTPAGEITAYSESLKNTFYISPWLLLVPVLMGILIIRRVPSLITLFLACFMACLCALIFQPHILADVSGPEVSGLPSQFRGMLLSLYGSTSVDTGHAALNELVSTRGMSGMMNTIWLIICAMCFGGAMTAGGMLGSIMSVFLRFMKNTVGIVSSTVFSGMFFNVCTGDQYLSIILTGDMYKDIYRKEGYESRLLSRSTEDGATVTSPLVPWNTCGMTQATVLGISTLTYLPYAFFNLVSPLMSILIAATGYKIKRSVCKEHNHKN